MMNANLDPRLFLKAYYSKDEESDEGPSDQQKGLPVPPMQKDVPEGSKTVPLIPADQITLGKKPLSEIVLQRRSRRKFTEEPLTLEELSFLLYSTQGLQRVIKTKEGKPVSSLRPSPSGGARHPFETYLAIRHVETIDPGLYRYLPLSHELHFLFSDPSLPRVVSEGCCGQEFAGSAPVVFIWTAVPYRMEWRYLKGRFSSKIIAQDSGHLCQNLYLAAESIGCGTCAIGAYFQDKMDTLLRVDGVDEFTIYVAPVGRIRKPEYRVIQPSILKKYCGHYSNQQKPDSVLQIGIEQKKLYLLTSSQMRLDLLAESETQFVIDLAESTITFIMSPDGNVTGFMLHQGDEEIFFERLGDASKA